MNFFLLIGVNANGEDVIVSTFLDYREAETFMLNLDTDLSDLQILILGPTTSDRYSSIVGPIETGLFAYAKLSDLNGRPMELASWEEDLLSRGTFNSVRVD